MSIVKGDIVRCIDPGLYLTKGKNYKVTGTSGDQIEEFVYVEGHPQAFYASRFELVETPKNELKTRDEWVKEFEAAPPSVLIDQLIKDGILKVRPETAEEIFVKNAVSVYGYMPRGTGGYLDEVFDMMQECNLELTFKDNK